MRMVSDDDEMAEGVLRHVLTATARIRMDRPPPFMGCEIHRIVREETGSTDPYASLKAKSTRRALDLVPRVERSIADSVDPFRAAVSFAIAGNVMDFGLSSSWDADKINGSFEEALSKELDAGAVRALQTSVSNARHILYLGDNAGETVFDGLLIRRFPENSVTYVVKGSPVINDATRADAEDAGIGSVAQIVDNGSDAPGTILELCSLEFQELFRDAEVVIAKGQANLETLVDSSRDIFFLTQIKCPVIGREVNREVGDWMIEYRPPGPSDSSLARAMEGRVAP